MKLLYFASVRQRLGKTEETLSVPDSVATVRDLAVYLTGLSPDYGAVFCDLRTLCAAVNQVHAGPDARVGDDDEVAFFPPVTGG